MDWEVVELKKVAILYPRGDNVAEEIAVKLMLNFDWVYVVYQRFLKPKIIYEKLREVKSAFFIWFSPEITKIDKGTKKYLEFLIANNKKVFAIISEDFILPYHVEKIERYNPDDIEDIFQKIHSIIGELLQKPKKNINYQNIILRVFIPILLISPKLEKFLKNSKKKFPKFQKIKNTEYQNQRHKYW
jgi:hypothetical protein